MHSTVVIIGPTAVGKSALAMALAERLGGEIVNADALQVYRGFDIGTAKPGPEDRSRVPHHLIDILEPAEAFSAGEFARRAHRAIAEIEGRGGVPLVVGGSGLYLRALLEGLSPIPRVPGQVRDRLRDELERLGLEQLREELRRVDPATEQRLAPGDKQRVLRALEVWRSTGKTLSHWVSQRPPQPVLTCRKVGLTLARGLLYDRIASRVLKMLDQGWIGEVRRLLDGGLTGTEPAFQAIGYREVLAHVEHQAPLAEVTEAIVGATRRYAKRQLTWFRREEDVDWYLAEDPGSLVRNVMRDVRTSQASGGMK